MWLLSPLLITFAVGKASASKSSNHPKLLFNIKVAVIGQLTVDENALELHLPTSMPDPSLPTPTSAPPMPTSKAAPPLTSPISAHSCSSSAARAAPAAQATPAVCRCGVPRNIVSSRIVGGEGAIKHEFPWQVGLARNDKKIGCGATLLSSTTIITAAHCKAGRFEKAVLSEHDQNIEDGEFSIPISIEDWEIHSEYKKNGPYSAVYDFAIITLKTPVNFTDTVYPVCLPSAETDYENRESIIAGWGTNSTGGTKMDVLQKAEVRTMANSACVEPATRYAPELITETMICAASPGKDACQNDSGGPLVTQNPTSGSYELIGMTSWGQVCADPLAPGVYARVTSVLEDWIKPRITGTTCSP